MLSPQSLRIARRMWGCHRCRSPPVATARMMASVGKANTPHDLSWAGRTESGAPASGAGGVVRRTARRPPRATPCAARATSEPGAVSTPSGRRSPGLDLRAGHSRERFALAFPFRRRVQQPPIPRRSSLPSPSTLFSRPFPVSGAMGTDRTVHPCTPTRHRPRAEPGQHDVDDSLQRPRKRPGPG